MFPLMIPMIIGAGAGMLANKKNPLEGALLGAGLGAIGGAAAQAFGLGASGATTAAPSAMSGILSGIKEYKPVLDAAVTGLQVANMVDKPEQPIQASPLMQYQGGTPQMNNLLNNMQNEQAQRMQIEQQRRAARRALL